MEKLHELFIESSGAITDTRKIKHDCMFFALKGDNFDGNQFAEKAIALGAKFAVVDDPNVLDDRMILVPDVLEALQQLATFHRRKLGTIIVALTGSNGKTTTKELIDVVLKTKYTTIATFGNLNNHIGVPLTLLSIMDDTQIAIVEMGANHQKEIEMLCNIALPDFGYITNFGKAHLEGFGGFEGVIMGKSEMYDHLRNRKNFVFVNGDDVLQMSKTADTDRFVFGESESAFDLNFQNVSANPSVCVVAENIVFDTKMIGIYNASNVMAAISIGKYFGVPLQDSAQAIKKYSPENNRSQLMEKGSVKILLDAYNANPSSMIAAIDNFAQLSGAKKIMILGDMFELGDDSAKEHRELVKKSSELDSVESIFVGPKFHSHKSDNETATFLPAFDDAKIYFENRIFSECTMLIKGSRGMALERLLEVL